MATDITKATALFREHLRGKHLTPSFRDACETALAALAQHDPERERRILKALGDLDLASVSHGEAESKEEAERTQKWRTEAWNNAVALMRTAPADGRLRELREIVADARAKNLASWVDAKAGTRDSLLFDARVQTFDFVLKEIDLITATPEPAAAPKPEHRFTCPECGGNTFGTSNCNAKSKADMVGNCHDANGRGCRYKWPRSEDWRVGLEDAPKPEPVAAPLGGPWGSTPEPDGDPIDAVAAPSVSADGWRIREIRKLASDRREIARKDGQPKDWALGHMSAMDAIVVACDRLLVSKPGDDLGWPLDRVVGMPSASAEEQIAEWKNGVLNRADLGTVRSAEDLMRKFAAEAECHSKNHDTVLDEVERLRKENADLRTKLEAEAKSRDEWKRRSDMVIAAWSRELGYPRRAKMHLIDELVVGTQMLRAKLEAAERAHKLAEASTKVERGLAQSAEKRVAYLEQQLAAATADQAAMARAIAWALGESPRGCPDFTPPEGKHRPYWWRSTLRHLANLPAAPDARTEATDGGDGPATVPQGHEVLSAWCRDRAGLLSDVVSELCRRELARKGAK